MSFKKFDGSTWQAITPKKLKSVPYTGTLPAVLTGTKAGYLHRYKIYGNTEQIGTPTPENPIEPQECGEKTENLFDKNAKDTAKGYENFRFLTTNGLSSYDVNYYVSEYISILPNRTYAHRRLIQSGAACAICFYDERKNFLSGFSEWYNSKVEAPSTASFCRLSIQISIEDNAVLTEGSTAPTSYIPYGYKLPLTSAGQSVDIYIGDDTISAEEYVDSRTGKIYRMVDGVLTPVDPPVPFPQIPTSANSTTISWAGEGLAPSEFDSIQEWVDIPTYVYTNGAWVEDN